MGRTHARACCRELGAELRARRRAAGLTCAELADRLGWWPAKVSRMETGHSAASAVDVLHYLGFCGVYLGQAKEIMRMCRVAGHADDGYWMATRGARLQDSIRSLVFHESTAIASTSYEPHVLPGLLQTEDYARQTIRSFESRTEEDLACCVAARLERQRVLHRHRPARFTFFVHEHAVRHQVGGPAVMHEQLVTLLLAGGLPHVTIRVVPAEAMFGGAFRLLEFVRHNPLVYLSSQVAGLFVEDKEYVEPYLELMPAIAAAALDGEQSRAFLAMLASDYDRGSAGAHVAEEQFQRGRQHRLR